jgi:uncharacterized protein YbjT (DUF2867 family)
MAEYDRSRTDRSGVRGVPLFGMHVALYGATGMVGTGVLLECIADPRITSVTCVGRKPNEVKHAKVRDLVRKDLFDYSDIGDALNGVDACFYCLGVTSVGRDEASYTRVTVDMTLAAANALAKVNPTMTFCFVSGSGTDSSGTSRQMWARVKGRAENALFAMKFRTYAFRPGLIQPMKGIRSKTGWYNAFYAVFGPIYAIFGSLMGSFATTTDNIGRTMIRVAIEGSDKKILTNADLNRLGAPK